MIKIFTHWTIAFLTLAAITFYGWQDPYLKEVLRLKGFDTIINSQEKTYSKDIVIVEIDEKAIEKYGQYPFNREIYSELIIKLRQANAGMILFPMLFSENDRQGGDLIFSEALQYGTVIAQVGTNQTNKNAVPRGIAKIGDPLPFLFSWGGMLGPIPELEANGVGVINTAPEIDGLVRRLPLLMRVGDDVFPAMAIETIRAITGDPSYQVKADANGIIAVRVPGFATIKTDRNARIWINHNKTFDSISIADDDLEFALTEGKTVIVSLTAEGLSPLVATSAGEQYNHYIIASSLQTIIDGTHIKRDDTSFLIEMILCVLIAALLIAIVRIAPYWLIGLFTIGVYIGSVYFVVFMFNQSLTLYDISWFIITFTIVAMHSIFNRFILEFNLKQQIRKQFEKYLDPRQVAILQKNPDKIKLGGDRKDMSFLFMDIVGFTPISEHYKNNDDPEGLVKVINDYLDRMTKIVLKNGGTIDKYMGDCIMAFWNAPLDCDNHAEMAVKTAIECAQETEEIKKEFKAKGLPEINIGSGVNSGTCIVGNMGSEMRLDYSVIGDAVNLAARLEAQTRNYKDDNGNVIPLLYSQYTKSLLSNIDSIEVDKIKVKGKEELITIYKPSLIS
jgi:adenylate cyclase|tara:strand:- start:7316 stop:9166 length:1851 start_codon:yes stop_codon:yes gene_type:complete